MTTSYLFFLVPIVAVVLGLKCCLLCWRIHYHQKRRDAARQAQLQQMAIARSQAARMAALNRSTLTRVVTRRPDGTCQTTYLLPTGLIGAAGNNSGAGGTLPSNQHTQQRPTTSRPTQPNRATILITPEELSMLAHACRRSDPNLPPTYEQAVTGKDKSVKLEEGLSDVAPHLTTPPPADDNLPPSFEYNVTPPLTTPPYNSPSSEPNNEGQLLYDEDEDANDDRPLLP